MAHPPALQRLNENTIERSNTGVWRKGRKKLELWSLHTFENGDVYVGEWNKDTDECDGYGIKVICKDGAIYQGYYDSGEKHGNGIYISGKGKFSGDYYIGDWEHNKKNGYGVYCYHDGKYYKGNWENNKSNGLGEKVTPFRSRYYGEFKDNLFHGFGIFTHSDGRWYEGEFKKGKMHGKAKWTTS